MFHNYNILKYWFYDKKIKKNYILILLNMFTGLLWNNIENEMYFLKIKNTSIIIQSSHVKQNKNTWKAPLDKSFSF